MQLHFQAIAQSCVSGRLADTHAPSQAVALLQTAHGGDLQKCLPDALAPNQAMLCAACLGWLHRPQCAGGICLTCWRQATTYRSVPRALDAADLTVMGLLLLSGPVLSKKQCRQYWLCLLHMLLIEGTEAVCQATLVRTGWLPAEAEQHCTMLVCELL